MPVSVSPDTSCVAYLGEDVGGLKEYVKQLWKAIDGFKMVKGTKSDKLVKRIVAKKSTCFKTWETARNEIVKEPPKAELRTMEDLTLHHSHDPFRFLLNVRFPVVRGPADPTDSEKHPASKGWRGAYRRKPDAIILGESRENGERDLG